MCILEELADPILCIKLRHAIVSIPVFAIHLGLVKEIGIDEQVGLFIGEGPEGCQSILQGTPFKKMLVHIHKPKEMQDTHRLEPSGVGRVEPENLLV